MHNLTESSTLEDFRAQVRTYEEFREFNSEKTDTDTLFNIYERIIEAPASELKPGEVQRGIIIGWELQERAEENKGVDRRLQQILFG